MGIMSACTCTLHTSRKIHVSESLGKLGVLALTGEKKIPKRESVLKKVFWIIRQIIYTIHVKNKNFVQIYM